MRATQFTTDKTQFNHIDVSSSPQGAKLAELGVKATFFDKIAAMSHQAFNALAATIPESMSGRKVLAALIMKTTPSDEGAVISLGTGACVRACGCRCAWPGRNGVRVCA